MDLVLVVCEWIRRDFNNLTRKVIIDQFTHYYMQLGMHALGSRCDGKQGNIMYIMVWGFGLLSVERLHMD